jgi:hypothetical protein
MRHAVSIGPLTLIGTDQTLSPGAFEPHHGRYSAIKVLALVSGASDVTVTVTLSVRDSLFLLYDPAARGNEDGFRVSDGDAQVRFEACPGSEPRYDGGFLLTEAGCVELDVESDGSGVIVGSFPIGNRASC